MSRASHSDIEYSIEDGQSPSAAVIHAVSIATDTDPLELPSLFDAVNPQALDNLFTDPSAGVVSFEWADCLVTFDGEGVVTVTPEE